VARCIILYDTQSGSYNWCSPQSKSSWYTLELRRFGQMTRILVPSPFMAPQTIYGSCIFSNLHNIFEAVSTVSLFWKHWNTFGSGFHQKKWIFSSHLGPMPNKHYTILPNACRFRLAMVSVVPFFQTGLQNADIFKGPDGNFICDSQSIGNFRGSKK